MSAGGLVEEKNTHGDSGRHHDMLDDSVYIIHYADVFFLKAKKQNTFPKCSMYYKK